MELLRALSEKKCCENAVVQTEANPSIKEGGLVEENVTVPVQTQTVTVSASVAKEVQTLESTVVQQVATNVPAAEQQDQLTVELLDRNQQTPQDPIKTVTVCPGDVKEGSTVENTVQHVMLITTVTTRPQTEELEDVHHDSYDENATLLTATPPSAVVHTEANQLIKEGGPVEENVIMPVAISNQEAQIDTVSADVAKEEHTLENTVVQQVATNVPAAEQQDQLKVELLDRNHQTPQDLIKTVTLCDSIEPTVENTVQHVVPITTVTTRPQTEELEDVLHDSYDENATLLTATAPSAVVQTETIRAIKEGPVEENVTVPVQTQTVKDSAAVATEEQSPSISATTQVSEPTVNIEPTNVRRSSRVSRKRHLSNPEPQPQAKKNTRRSAPPAQPTAATRPATVGPSRAGPWVCAECGQGFTGSGVLATHVRAHTGEKPYRCNWTGCDFSAGDRSNVARHVRGVHLKLPVTKKEQRELGIVQQRHERDYIIKVEQED